MVQVRRLLSLLSFTYFALHERSIKAIDTSHTPLRTIKLDHIQH